MFRLSEIYKNYNVLVFLSGESLRPQVFLYILCNKYNHVVSLVLFLIVNSWVSFVQSSCIV